MASQSQVELLAEFSWHCLEDVFDCSGRRLPPIYLFLSPKSRGSLKRRSQPEIDFVHFQQMHDGGATLKSPPAAWVSKLEQVPEECAHLFCIRYKQDKLPKINTALAELRTTTLFECFGRFAQGLVFGGIEESTSRPKARIQSEMQLWDSAHREGYFLGERLTELYFREQLKLSGLRRIFKKPWVGPTSSLSRLRELYALLGQKPPNLDFSQRVS